MQQTWGDPFSQLQGHNFLQLTTFRKSGEAVSAPVWFAKEGEKLYVLTWASAGKVKRIRQNAQVEVAPCTHTGKPLGSTVEAMASILPGDLEVEAISALNRKYGLQKRIYDLFHLLRGVHRVYLEILPM